MFLARAFRIFLAGREVLGAESVSADAAEEWAGVVSGPSP